MYPESVPNLRWGRKWGRLKIEKGFRAETLWGSDVNAGDTPISGRQTVRLVRGNIVPCNTCSKIAVCAMYQSFTRHRLRNNEYMQGTNILHLCDVYISNKSPSMHGNKAPQIHGRTSGKLPT